MKAGKMLLFNAIFSIILFKRITERDCFSINMSSRQTEAKEGVVK